MAQTAQISAPKNDFTMPTRAEAEKMATTGVGTDQNAAFRKLLEPLDKKSNAPAFDGGSEAMAREATMRGDMERLNKGGALSQIINMDDLDKEFNFLTELIIQDFKDPDPSQEKDHSEHTRTLVALISAGEQAQMAKLLKDQNALIRQDQRISMENRIGKKVQYQDTFFEVRDDDNTVPIYYRLGRDAAIGSIKILDETGKIVQEIQLDKKGKGDHKIDWDRSLKGINPETERAGPGVYFIQFEALDHEDKRVENIVELEGVVSHIDANEDGGSDYYIAGIKVDGRITKVSQAHDETASALKHLRSINPDYFSGKPITPEVAGNATLDVAL